MEPVYTDLIIGTAGLGGFGWFLYSNFPKIEALIEGKLMSSLTRESSDKSSQPLQNIFYLYKHDSVKSWMKWMEGQDSTIKDTAYLALIRYLDTEEQEELGALTPEVIRTLPIFKRQESFGILTGLIQKCTNQLHLQIGMESYIEEAVYSLLKQENSKTEAFLLSQYAKFKQIANTSDLRTSLVKALVTYKIGLSLLPMIVDFMTDETINAAQRHDVIETIEHSLEELKRVEFFKGLFLKLLFTAVKILEDFNKAMVAIFGKIESIVFCENYDQETWKSIFTALSGYMRPTCVRILEHHIQNKGQYIAPEILLEFLKLDEPVKACFRDLIVRRFGITDKEMEIFKSGFKSEDLEFLYTASVFEKSKKPKSVCHELLPEYQTLEKMIFSSDSQSRELLSTIQVLTGPAIEEKVYLLRALCANHSRTFVYADIEKIIIDPQELNKLKQIVSNNKPCFVYFDTLEKFLLDGYLDIEENALKELTKIIKEFVMLPSVSLFANLPYTREELKNSKQELLKAFQVKEDILPFKISLELDNPDDKIRKKILLQFLGKVEGQRAADSLEFNLEEFLLATDGLSMLAYLQMLHKYFEVALFGYGRLIALDEFRARVEFGVQKTNDDFKATVLEE